MTPEQDKLLDGFRSALAAARSCRQPWPCEHCEALALSLLLDSGEYAAAQVELHARGSRWPWPVRKPAARGETA